LIILYDYTKLTKALERSTKAQKFKLVVFFIIITFVLVTTLNWGSLKVYRVIRHRLPDTGGTFLSKLYLIYPKNQSIYCKYCSGDWKRRWNYFI